MGGHQRPFAYQCHAVVLAGYLEGLPGRSIVLSFPSRQPGHESSYLAIGKTGGDRQLPGADLSSDLFHDLVLFSGQQDLFFFTFLAHDFQDLFNYWWMGMLDFDDDPGLGNGGKELLESGDFYFLPAVGVTPAAIWSEPVAAIKYLELFKAVSAYSTVPVCGPPHRGVVEDRYLSVFAAPYVQLDELCALLEGPLKGDQGILRRLARRAPMADDAGLVAAEEWEVSFVVNVF